CCTRRRAVAVRPSLAAAAAPAWGAPSAWSEEGGSGTPSESSSSRPRPPPGPAAAGGVAALAGAGRCAEALRELRRLEACGAQPDAALDAELLEQVRRVGTRYEETLEMLSWQVRDLPVFESNEELRLEWGFRSSGNMVWVVVVWDTPDVDLVRALAGRLERSLSDHYDTGVISCEPLWQKRAYEEIWHKVA
ncbi:unnamed protein product, partial [Prorocentrum cordatum]